MADKCILYTYFEPKTTIISSYFWQNISWIVMFYVMEVKLNGWTKNSTKQKENPEKEWNLKVRDQVAIIQ